MKKSRPAPKAPLHSLRGTRVPPAVKEPPEKMRALGIELTRRSALPIWNGSRDGYEVTLLQVKTGQWLAELAVGAHCITPHLTSASPAAAIRNLRGTVLNLAISIGKLFPRRKS